jgi:hypothetical protein
MTAGADSRRTLGQALFNSSQTHARSRGRGARRGRSQPARAARVEPGGRGSRPVREPVFPAPAFVTPLQAAISTLAELLGEGGVSTTIRVVGGAILVVAYGRQATTTDIDALYGASDDVSVVVATIPARRGWPDTWLNDRVKMFASHYDHTAGWVLLATGDNVEVWIAPADLLLAMKLLAGRRRRDRSSGGPLREGPGSGAAPPPVNERCFARSQSAFMHVGALAACGGAEEEEFVRPEMVTLVDEAAAAGVRSASHRMVRRLQLGRNP